MSRKSRAIPVLVLTGLLVVSVVSSACSPTIRVEVAGLEPAIVSAGAAEPGPRQAEKEAVTYLVETASVERAAVVTGVPEPVPQSVEKGAVTSLLGAADVERAAVMAGAAEPDPRQEKKGIVTSVADVGGVRGWTPGRSGLASAIPYTHDMKVLFEEMTLVQLLWEQTGYAKTLCAGNGLNNVKPLPDGVMILIPNAGDLAAGGSNVAIKLSPDGEITFIPRVQGTRIKVPMDVGDKLEGEEVLGLSFDEAMQLMAADILVWTAKDKGPYRNGHGLPGHIAACDPSFNEKVYLKWEAKQRS